MKTASLHVVPANRFARRRERTRQELLAAASRVLAEKGLHQTKIADIAAAADVGVGTFYLYFPTKEALFDAVVDDSVRRLKQTVDLARTAAREPIERMRAANAAFCRFAQDNREVFKIVFGHAAAFNDVVRDAQELFAADIEETLREGIEAGVFTALPTGLTAQAVIGMVTQMLSWWTQNESVPLETIHETVMTLALRGLSPAADAKGVHHG